MIHSWSVSVPCRAEVGIVGYSTWTAFGPGPGAVRRWGRPKDLMSSRTTWCGLKMAKSVWSSRSFYNIWYILIQYMILYVSIYVIYGWFFLGFWYFWLRWLPRQGRNLTTMFFSVVGSPSVRTIAISLPSSVEPLSDGYQQQAKGGKLEPYLPRLFEVFSRRYRMKEKHL